MYAQTLYTLMYKALFYQLPFNYCHDGNCGENISHICQPTDLSTVF